MITSRTYYTSGDKRKKKFILEIIKFGKTEELKKKEGPIIWIIKVKKRWFFLRNKFKLK